MTFTFKESSVALAVIASGEIPLILIAFLSQSAAGILIPVALENLS